MDRYLSLRNLSVLGKFLRQFEFDIESITKSKTFGFFCRFSFHNFFEFFFDNVELLSAATII